MLISTVKLSQSLQCHLLTEHFFAGFKAQINTLDNAASRLPAGIPVVIVTASFEGEPADNAAQFVAWISSLKTDGGKGALDGVSYTIFGCGNREWVRTYQRIPRLIDEKMAEAGADRMMERGEGDAASADFFQKFDEFEDQMWGVLEKVFLLPTYLVHGCSSSLCSEIRNWRKGKGGS